MSHLVPPPGLLRPPADRPAGRRGVRGPIAAIAAIAALVPLSYSRVADETALGGPALVAAAAALIAGALLLWTVRRPVAIAAAVVLVLAGATGATIAIGAESRAENQARLEADRWRGSAFSFPRARGAVLTRAEAEAIPTGLTRERLTARLGTPSAKGVQHLTGEPDMRCVAYRSTRRKPVSQLLHAFCFRHGRYAELGEW
jgi:hypothetical protein